MNVVPDGPKPSVVLVDDSPEVRSLVRRRLELSGLFEVVGEGADGDQAIGLVYRHEPALLLLDVSMPTADGVEALPAILAVSPATKVVIFTGFEAQGLAQRALEYGATDFIEKSIDLDELPARLMRSLDSETGPTPRQRLSVVEELSDDEQRVLAGEQRVLDEHLEQFRMLFDQATIGMAVLTVTGTVVRANRALADLMSCSPFDLVGVDYGRLTGGEGDALDRGLRTIYRAGRDLATFEHLLPVPEGEEPSRVVRVTLAPVRDSLGRALYTFAQVQDITAQRAAEGDLRRSEATFRLLVTAVAEYAIFMLDVDGNIVSWNAGAQRIKGYTAAEIVGRSFRVFYLPEERASGHPEHNLEVALRDGTLAEEGWRVRKDGSRFWASVVISPVHDDAGRHIGFAKVTRDQTEQLAHEEHRRTAIADQAHLLAVTAHELRSPTAVIDGAAATLQSFWDRMSADQRAELLDGIRTSAHRLRRFESDLSAASRVHVDALELRRDDVSLRTTIQGATTRRKVADPGAQVEVDVPHDIVVCVDPERLGQALDNLVDNALRHGLPPVEILGTAAGDEVKIRVTDRGPGVPADLVPRLFERFVVGETTGGTGLGLYLVREIARAHGGDVTYLPPADGEPPTFEMRLPRET
ncbi:PAS domain S-box protein [Nocardioides guangzhouensis]|uniref:PAS domain S-box protein n=1 Tax=Nocardioides guangzhouensis TaxID=2497878 RepID=UPI001FE6ADE9|nr:PAS domain S-box protein [Nocardioides guangzhouensis]